MGRKDLKKSNRQIDPIAILKNNGI